MKIIGVHHVTVAVRDLEGARADFARLFGMEAGAVAAVPAFGVRVQDLAAGGDALQLAAPDSADTPVMRFIERKGEGFYNLALEVEDLDSAVDELARQGVRVSRPAEATPGLRSAFVAMAATHGLSIQLVERIRARAAPGPGDAGGPDEAPGREPAAAAAETPPLDLTPDEWSDVD